MRKQEELEATRIRYYLLLDKDELSSPAGKTDLPAGNAAFSAVESIVCKKVAAEEKIKELKEELTKQSKVINAILERLENPYEKLVMQMRYEDGLEWDEIRGKYLEVEKIIMGISKSIIIKFSRYMERR